jgi:surfeit locus 1 family protein
VTAHGTAGRRLLVVLMLTAAAGFAALGVWQLERRAWKLDLIERVDRRIHAAPVPVPPPEAWPSINAASDVYRRVSVEGHFLHDHETLVQAVTEQGAGYWVLTPLRAKDTGIVLVNRGFVPPDRRDPATRRTGNPEHSVRVTGLLRISEPGGGFLRNNDPQADRWYSRDVAAIAAARNLPAAAPFFIDADATPNHGGWPLGGLTVVAFHNNHLVYVITWFALALMAGGATLLAGREDWRGRRDALDSPEIQRFEHP